MIVRNAYQGNISVNSAVKSEVCLLRIDKIIRGIIDLDLDFILILDVLKLNSERRISAVMCRELFAVKIDCRRRIYAVKLKIKFLARRKILFFQSLFIGAGATEIIVSAVLSVLTVPSVRQIERYALALFCKVPLGVDIFCLSHNTVPH